MSEPIGHMAVADDCRRLALESDEICDSFKQVLDRHPLPVRMGSMTRSGATYLVPLLEQYRGGDLDDIHEKRLAFVLGWIFHRAADRFYKTIYRQLDPEAEKTHNIRIYHDLVLYEKVYGNGTEDPFMPGVLEEAIESQPGHEALDVKYVEHLFGAKWLQDMLELHSFIDDDADIDAWMENMLSRRQYYRLDHQGAYESPDPDKMESFITNANFYDLDDPIIKLVRSIQREALDQSLDTDVDVETAVEDAIRGSQYARSLNLGFVYLRAASQYFTGSIDKPMLKYRLHLSPMQLIAGEFGGSGTTDITTKMEDPSPGEPVPPGRLTTIAVTDDCRRLIQNSDAITGPMSECLDRHPDAARIGGVLRSPDEHLPGLIQRLRDQWPTGDDADVADMVDNDIDPEYVAFVAGALCYTTAETQFDEYATEQRLRHDVTVLRELGNAGDTRPADADEIADLLECFWLRSIVGLHTFVPDSDDVEGWMDRLFHWAIKDEGFRHRYADAYTALGEETDTEFYDHSDQIITAARALQRGDDFAESLETAITTTPRSQYAEAVRNGFQNIAEMNQILHGESDPEMLTNTLVDYEYSKN